MPYINVDEAYILDNTGLQVDMATDIPFADAGFTDAQKAQARKNIAAGGSNPNLLDNAYFVGGGSQLGDGVFPINQRGLTSYTNTTYVVDRWRMWVNTSTVTLTASGLTFATGANADGLFQYFPQGKIESLYGLTVTASLLLTDGTLYTATGVADAACWIATDINGGYFGYTNGYLRVNLDANKSISIKAVKLEVGTVSTLANDPPPDFGEELRKCQRYLYIPTFPWYAWTGTVAMATSATDFNWVINTPVPMRQGVIPTIGITNSVYINGTAVSNLAIGNYPVGNLVKISGTSAGMTNGQLYPVNTSANNVSVILSAEL